MSSPSSPPEKTLKGGRYTLVRALGEGSQGETWEARDNDVDRTSASERPRPEALLDDWNRYVSRARVGETGHPRRDAVAIKCFRIGKAKAWKDVELAEREAKTLAALDHPRLPRYIEHFEENGVLYLVMEKIEGESLAALRSRRDGRRQPTLGVSEITQMLEDVSEALRYLHGRAPYIVHRDVKPGNILRRPDGSYALVDFGAVRDRLKPAGGSTIVGTFGYMAPEQFQGRASPKSDVYGLGVTAITMLTGCEPEDLPHEGLGIDVARALPTSTPPQLVRALAAMVEPDPDRRASSVDEALALLRSTARSQRPTTQGSRGATRELTRHEKREQRREKKREAREEKRRRRSVARSREAMYALPRIRVPFFPRLFAKLGLLIALIAVWVAVGLVAPLVLVLLSLVFGEALRRAARACVRAAKRSQAALGRASSWVSGFRNDSAAGGEPAQIRVASELDQVRTVTERVAQELALARAEARAAGAEAWEEERLASESEQLELDDDRKLRRAVPRESSSGKRRL